MKILIISSLVTIATGVGIYFIGGLSTLLLTMLIPLFLLSPILIIGASLVMGAMDGIGDLIGGIVENIGDKFDENFGKQPVTVQAN